MSFTTEEISLIRRTWKPIQSSPEKWPRLFIILFTDDAELKKLFTKFADVPNNELANNKRVKAHAAGVVSLISGFVLELNDMETMVEMIKDMASRHRKREITIPMFQTLGAAIIKWLKESDGEAMDEKAVAVWTKLYNALVSTVEEKYSELDKSSS